MADLSFNSLGDIAAKLQVPVHRVEYVIRTRFIHASVNRIASEIQRIDEERGGYHA